MKKLKVILPAILTLAVSTSAAVTGTVAWFTATRLRTVKMNNIAVVDPEQGLVLEKVIGTNVKLENVKADGTITNPSNPVEITHANYKVGETDTQGYLRDASVDVNSGTVYRGVLDQNDAVTSYATQDIAVADQTVYTTYDDKQVKVFYATKVELTFSIKQVPTAYDAGLYLDLDLSSVKKPTKDAEGNDLSGEVAADTNSLKLYNAVRFGFKCGSEWFVWAPFTSERVDGTGTKKAQYVSGATLTDYQAANFTFGNEEAVADTLVEDTATGVIANDNENSTGKYYIGYLGTLAEYEAGHATKKGTTVTMYTWFEGTDDDCISTNFTEALQGLTADLKFVMRKTANA